MTVLILWLLFWANGGIGEVKSWIRLYTDVPHNPKVQRLPDHLFKFLVNCWCLTGLSEDNALPSIEDLSWRLQLEVSQCETNIVELLDQKLLTRRQGSAKLVPKDWQNRQYISDSSKVRTRKYRGKKKIPDGDGGGDVTVTPQSRADTDTDTDTEQTQNRAEEKPPLLAEDNIKLFAHFELAYMEAKPDLMACDFVECRWDWDHLDFNQKMDAISGVRDRIESGEWSDPRFVMMPKKFIAKREWRRKIALRAKGRPETAIEQMIREAGEKT